MRITSNAALLTQQDTRAARYASGFGCIRCGCTIFLYCHLEGHEEEQAFLLCADCRDRLNAMEDMAPVLAVLRRHPVAGQTGFNRAPLPYMRGYDIPDTHFPGGIVMRRTAFPIVFGGKPVIGLVPPEVYGGPVQLTMMLGRAGEATEVIVNANEWMAGKESWRFVWRGNRYRFESVDGTALLVLAFVDGDRIFVEQLRCHRGAHLLEIDANGVRLDGKAIELANSDSKVIGRII
ncbi:MAG TPA: hypothetical protein VGE05_07030 [Novosphingobium sp.]